MMITTIAQRCKTCLEWPKIHCDNGWWWVECECARIKAVDSRKTRSECVRAWNRKQKGDRQTPKEPAPYKIASYGLSSH